MVVSTGNNIRNDISKAKKFIDQEGYQNHILKAKHNAPFLFLRNIMITKTKKIQKSFL